MYTYAKSVRLSVCLLGMSHMNASHNKRESAQARPEPLSATFQTELIKPPATAE